jgi:hypothetical protein
VRSILAAVLLAMPVSAHAQRCPRDTLRVELPSAPGDGEASASIHIRRRAGDPYDGPDGGTCVVRDGVATLVAPNEDRTFAIRADGDALTPIGVGREVLHVSMPAGSEIAFVSIACHYFRIEAADLAVADHHGEGPDAGEIYVGATRRLARTPYGGPCSAENDATLSPSAVDCTFRPQLGYCAYAKMALRGRQHSFWPRAGERWRIAVDRGRIVSSRR